MSHPPPPPTTLSTSTSPALIAARGTPSSSTLTTPPSPTTTCNHEAMVVDLPQIEGLPMSRSVWAMPRWDESLAGMTACCNLKPDNEVRMGGPDGCALWCLIPDVFLFEQKEKVEKDGTTTTTNGKRWDRAVVSSAMRQCVKDKGNLTGPYIAVGQIKEGGAAAALSVFDGKVSLKMVVGTAIWSVVVLGLLG